jgi:hypothetical protein
VDLGVGYRFNRNIRFVFDISGHSLNRNDESFTRINAVAGVEFDREDCDKEESISVFSRIAIGMMHDRKFVGEAIPFNGNAIIGDAGVGADVKLGPNASLRVAGDYMPGFLSGGVQHNFRLSTGLVLRLGGN